MRMVSAFRRVPATITMLPVAKESEGNCAPIAAIDCGRKATACGARSGAGEDACCAVVPLELTHKRDNRSNTNGLFDCIVSSLRLRNQSIGSLIALAPCRAES